MLKKHGLTQFTLEEFKSWLQKLQVKRTIRAIQQHHTWSPHYNMCSDANQFALCVNMRHFHVDERGWSDIGQTFTTFPDGCIIYCRDIEKSPACIYGNNSGSICIEHIGNFDRNKDTMTDSHKATIIGMTAALCDRFNLAANDRNIVYHHWFNLNTGLRNNGTGFNKSCPGSDFFGGNSVASAEANFFPLVRAIMQNIEPATNSSLRFYAKVTASLLLYHFMY